MQNSRHLNVIIIIIIIIIIICFFIYVLTQQPRDLYENQH
jgi:uncharacterized protein YpmB